MGSRLRLFDMIELSFRAYFDLKRDRVAIENKDVVIRNPKRGDRIKGAPEEPAAAVGHYTCINSPLVMRELSNYENYREHYLSRRKNLYWIRAFVVLPVLRVSSFTNMLNNLDYQINDFESMLNTLTVRYGEMIAEQNRFKDGYERNGESHMVQLCINRANKLRMEYYKKSVHIYRALIAQLTVKAGRLKKAEDDLVCARTWHFHKIRVYHEKVWIYSPYSNTRFDSDYMSDEKLSMKCNAETADRYKTDWMQTKDMLEKYSKELERITPAVQKK